MAINFTRLFTRLGKILGGLGEVNTYRGTTLDARVTTIGGLFASVNPELSDGLYTQKTGAKSGFTSWLSYLSTLASNVIVSEVDNDRPLATKTFAVALPELVRQMTAAAESINAAPCTLTPATVTATGDVQYAVSGKDGTGFEQDLIVPDVYLLQTTADKDNGGTKWAETLSLAGKPADTAATDDTYPKGSGLVTSLTVTDPAGNTGLLSDTTFNNWTTNTPTSWILGAGTLAGTHVYQGADDPRDGATGKCLRLVADGSVLIKVRQKITVTASTVYAYNFRLKKVADPGTDWAVSVLLVDASGAAITGPNSFSNTATSATAASVASNWTNVVRGTFITPATLPTEVWVEIRFHQFGSVSTAAVNTAEVYVDHVYVKKAAQLYTGGPFLTAFSGITATVNKDSWTLTAALTSGAITDYIIRGLDRLLNLKGYGVRIPTSGSPTQLDALIS
jgi:hypothetical protein